MKPTQLLVNYAYIPEAYAINYSYDKALEARYGYYKSRADNIKNRYGIIKYWSNSIEQEGRVPWEWPIIEGQDPMITIENNKVYHNVSQVGNLLYSASMSDTPYQKIILQGGDENVR